MTYGSKKALGRRTVLRGLGAAISLPLLDAMFPALVPYAKAAAAPRMRFGATYFPNGVIVPQFTPKTTGANFEFSPILTPFVPFKKYIVVVTGLTRSHPGSQVGDHAVSAAGFLTGVWPKRTEAEDVLANTSIDQHIAQKIGQETPLPSLELATEDFSGYVGGCSPGFSCAYMNTISWRTPKTPNPMETNPRAVFERLFGEAGTSEQRRARLAKQRSILDSLAEDTRELERGLGASDRARLGGYLENVREIERRIQQSEARNSAEAAIPAAPIGTPDNFEEHVALMFDLAAAAFEADVTRVYSFMMSRELSQRTYPQIGVTEQHHTVSHHLNNAQKMAQMVKVNTYYASMYAKFLTKLAATPDGDGSVLDHSMLVYGAGMADSNGHVSDPLPMVIIGGGAGKGARHVEVRTRTPIGNLWRNVADSFDAPVETYGDSDGITNVLA
jgi:hypothetical protein